MNAYIFPGQGSQFSGMGFDLYNYKPAASELFEKANEILGYRITETMFSGSEEELKETHITQPAIFIHSAVLALTYEDFQPDMVAGHSLGEFSALVANKALSFEDGLLLVHKRATAMQKACENNPSSMAAIIGLSDEKVEEICHEIEGIVVPANYNCPGQLVISGSNNAVNLACEKMKEAGAKRALPLPVGGAFHSPLMEEARAELEKAIDETTLSQPTCPVYQNYTAKPAKDKDIIKQNLIYQLTNPVKWTQTIQNMVSDGANVFYECGPGKVLQTLVKKIEKDAEVASVD